MSTIKGSAGYSKYICAFNQSYIYAYHYNFHVKSIHHGSGVNGL